jgi:hypothetical protein
VRTGTISDLDADGLYGLIDADDGRLVLFNLWGIDPPLRPAFGIGARVEFVDQSGFRPPRALALALLPH